jgi:outer membrane immunogenic protein
MTAYFGERNQSAVSWRWRHANWHGAPSSTRVGWTIGVGVEYAITDNITLRGEYLYYNLGSSNLATVPNLAASAFFPGVYATARYNYDGSILRVGMNFKF